MRPMNMKRNLSARHTVAALVFGSMLCMAPATLIAEPTPDSKGWSKEITETVRKFQNQLSHIFRATHEKDDGKSAYSASIDVREGTEGYTVRIHLPERDVSKVDVSLDK